jgi:hypothetical protein
MINYIGNCSDLINWDSVINEIKDLPGVIIDSTKLWNETVPGYSEITNILKNSDADMETVQWINYYPGTDFNKDIVDIFSNYVSTIPIRSWISKVNPGYYVPYHWDVDDNIEEYLKLGNLKRFTCFITESSLGQILMVDTEYLFNQEKGSIYKWDNYNDWHASTNASYLPKYLFHFLGYQK